MTKPFLLTRRQTVTAGAAFAALAASGTASAADAPAMQGQAVASGTVFEDTDESGAPGAAPKGIAGVMVSNGRNVVKTDTDGKWSLPVRPGDSVFVIKPAGWMTPVDPETQLPRFALVYSPEGTPENLNLRFAGLPPSPLPEGIDFPLRRHQEAARFNAILFTDPQPETVTELNFVRDDVMAATAGFEAAFGITHGHVMFDDLSQYDRHNRIVSTAGVPWYNCCGNHDMNLEAPDDVHSRDTFKRVFGARYHALQYGQVTFFVLDNVEYMGTDRAKPNGFGAYRGHFGEDQLAFVRNVLANVPRDSLVVYSFHIPIRTLAGNEPSIAAIDAKEFLAAIATHPNSVSFSGHTHTNEHWYFGAAEGFPNGTHHHHVLSAVSGSWWSGPFDVRGIPVALASDGSPNGFHVLEIDGNRYATRLIPAHEPDAAQLRIMLESQLHGDAPEVLCNSPPGATLRGPIGRQAASASRVVVNFFDGGPRSKVEMAVGRDGQFAAMQKIERLDPFVVEVYARNPDTKKPWVQPGKSSHIWQAILPRNLPAGTHRIAVRATDEFGRQHDGSIILEITG